MIIQRIYNAAIGATYDRAQITKDSNHVKNLIKSNLIVLTKKEPLLVHQFTIRLKLQKVGSWHF